ncbi:hypothetical protein GCM10023066_09790 [Nocardioides kongjuensis]
MPPFAVRAGARQDRVGHRHDPGRRRSSTSGFTGTQVRAASTTLITTQRPHDYVLGVEITSGAQLLPTTVTAIRANITSSCTSTTHTSDVQSAIRVHAAKPANSRTESWSPTGSDPFDGKTAFA